MAKNKTFKFNKLIRDKILDSMLSDSEQEPDYRILNKSEYREELKSKLKEEVDELLSANEDSVLEELADIEEIIEHLLKSMGSDRNALQKIIDAKRSKVGGFEERIYINSNTVNAGSSWVDKYREQPEKYIEIYNIKAILFDFDGTLSNGRFYSTLSESESELYEKIQQEVFTKDNWELLSSWMRGKIEYKEFNAKISTMLNVPVELLNNALIESVKEMKLNQDLLKFAVEQRAKGIQTAIFTDNMDIFEKVFVVENKLDEKFDYIFSSSTYGMLKEDNGGEFLDIAVQKFGVDISEVLFIDNSLKAQDLMNSKGGVFYLWEDYENEFTKFIEWFTNHTQL